VASECDDGIKNGTEADVDCGGSCAAKCAVGLACGVGADCASTICNVTTHLCVASQCDDGIKNGTEADVDCGGVCVTKCEVGLACGVGFDCASSFCNGTTHLCVASQCDDGIKNGTEADVDCGGVCATKCEVGLACGVGFDCASSFCNGTTHLCVASQCEDGVKNGTEADVDCGGSCAAKCAVNSGCGLDADCASIVCNITTHLCVATRCEDGAQDQDETDVDCGGSCATKCAVGSGCALDLDCTSAICNGTTFLCVASQCEDGMQGQDETAVDCGGSCATQCAVGSGCALDLDCASAFCNVTTHLCVATQCEDGVQDGAEGDVDCGGSCATTCAVGSGCFLATDCTSAICNGMTNLCVATLCEDGMQDQDETAVDCGGVCVACSTCQDGLRNGAETDIDCGGGCGACVGEACTLPTDCASGLCPSGVCVTPVGSAPPRPLGTLNDIGRFMDGDSVTVDLPATITASASINFGTKLYVLGGNVDGMLSSAIYEATVGEDGLVSSFALNPTYALATARSSARAEVIGRYLYVFGGSTDTGPTTSIERAVLDANGIASAFQNLPLTLVESRWNFQTLVTAGHVYVVGGNWPQSDTIEVATVDAVGALSGSFTMLERTPISDTVVANGMVDARWTHGALRLGNYWYVLGGEGLSTIERTVINPDGTLGNFEKLAFELPTGRNRLSVVALADTVYVFGGWNQGFLTEVEVADITDNELGPFSTATTVLEVGVEDGCALLTSKAVYLFGGSNSQTGQTNYIQRGLIQAP
jgi:hypothetical protein